jgi:hypothetical protein
MAKTFGEDWLEASLYNNALGVLIWAAEAPQKTRYQRIWKKLVS